MTSMKVESAQGFANGDGYLPIASYPVQALTSKTLSAQILDRWQRQQVLCFVNTNFVVKCEALREQLRSPDVILVNDGIGMDIASYLLHGRVFPQNLNGTDFVPMFIKHCGRTLGQPCRVFLLGGKPGVAQKAAASLAREAVSVCGHRDGYSGNDEEVLRAINENRADIVLVAMGNPLQEEWMLRNRAALNAKLLVGVGALLDFLAGEKPRAPNLIQKLRLEWLYRLSLEPRRLLKRYSWDILIFFKQCYRHRSREDFNSAAKG